MSNSYEVDRWLGQPGSRGWRHFALAWGLGFLLLSLFWVMLPVSLVKAATPTIPQPDNAAVVSTGLLSGTMVLSAPVIDVWYGSRQSFGQPGLSQRWINILGNVTPASGSTLETVAFSLNGGPAEALNLGPDTRRLADAGDFNVELDPALLLDGSNQVVISATDSLSRTRLATVEVVYAAGREWPLPYTIDWSSVTTLTEAIQIVDGLWEIEDNGLRTTQIDYDRVIAFGDIGWSDYEILVPITINGYETNIDPIVSVSAGFGITPRWTGHSDDPPVCAPDYRPHCGWLPSGFNGWYDMGEDAFYLKPPDFSDPEIDMNVGDTYWWRLRTETNGNGVTYSVKVWPVGDPEPEDWTLSEGLGTTQNKAGSLVVVAHHVDLTLGDVQVRPLNTEATLTLNTIGDGRIEVTPDGPIYNIDDIVTLEARPDPGWEFIEWQGDLSGTTNPISLTLSLAQSITAVFTPSQNIITYTLSTRNIGQGNVVVDPQQESYIANTTLTLTAQADPGWAFVTWQNDLSGSTNPAFLFMDADKLVTAVFTRSQGFVSDDFNVCAFDPERWTFSDPDGDTELTFDGRHAIISLPEGSVHDTWGTNAADFQSNVPRLTQAVGNNDFQLEASFMATMSASSQYHGLLLVQDENDLIRVEFLRDQAGVKAFAASFAEGANTQHHNQPIPGGTDADTLWMRVTRSGDTWTQAYSLDGENWNNLPSFNVPLTLTEVALYAGNADVAHTVAVDYVFNTTSPISPEDAIDQSRTLTRTVVGSGQIVPTPDAARYACNTSVTVEAVPAEDWLFVRWEDDLNGIVNPTSLTLDTDKTVTAVFTEAGLIPTYTLELNVEPGGSVDVTPKQDFYLAGSPLTLTVTANPGWQFLGWRGDATGDTNPLALVMDRNRMVTATFGLSNTDDIFVSDDFNACQVNAGLWTFSDPDSDTDFYIDGQHVVFSLPAGSVHDTWGNDAADFQSNVPRLTQQVANTDLQLEAGFIATMSLESQYHGLLFVQDDNDMIRFEFLHAADGMRAFVASFADGTPTVRANAPIPNQSRLWMRVDRSGDTWTQAYSVDGENWNNVASFTRVLSLSEVSLYAGNADAAHTVAVDYIFDQTAPIQQEDSQDRSFALSRNANGPGRITARPDQVRYGCNTPVQLAAVPDTGAVFAGWSGDLTGAENPVTVVINQDLLVNATFRVGQNMYLPLILR